MSETSAETEIPFASLGKKLMQAREARGLSIEQVAKATRIRPHLLAHLEGDEFTHFSHPSYLRLYLMDYARFLNVPFQEIRDWLPDTGRPGCENYEYIESLGAEEKGKPRPEYFYPRGNRRKFWPLFVRGALTLAVLVLLAAVAILIRDINRIGTNGIAPSPIAAESALPPAVEPIAPDAQSTPPALEPARAEEETAKAPEDSPAEQPPVNALLTSPAPPPAETQIW